MKNQKKFYKRYFIETVEDTHWYRDPNPDDRWDAGDREGTVTGVTVHEWETENPNSGYETLPKFAVVVGYETGSTFGRDFASTVVECFDDEEPALRLAAEIDRVYGGYTNGNGRPYSFVFEGKEYYASWEGYFERIQSVDVFPINNTNGRRYRYV